MPDKQITLDTPTMKTSFAALILSIASFAAVAAQPTDASIEALLVRTKVEAVMDAIYANYEQTVRQGMERAAAGKQLSEEQRRVLEIAPKKFAEILKHEFTWSALKPVYIKIYKESFDQEDIDGLNAFYSSKAGQAYINKMPIVMQRTMESIQEFLQPLTAKMTQAMKAAITEAQLEN